MFAFEWVKRLLPGDCRGAAERVSSQNTYLSNQHKHNQDQAKIAAVDTSNGLEGNLVDRVAVVGPSAAEPDMREADAAPGEESGQARQGQQPIEDFGPTGVEVYICQAAKQQNDADTPEGAARAVDICWLHVSGLVLKLGVDCTSIASLMKGQGLYGVLNVQENTFGA